MNYEEKQLLITDLCGRAPYGVRVKIRSADIRTVRAVDIVEGIVHFVEPDTISPFGLHIEDPLSFRQKVKPYLRPMSSMTDEERDEFRTVGGVMSHSPQHDTWAISAFAPEAYDWLNAHQFDYRGLIEKHLAIVAPENMYK